MCMNMIFRQMGVALLIAFGVATSSMGQGFMEVVRENLLGRICNPTALSISIYNAQ